MGTNESRDWIGDVLTGGLAASIIAPSDVLDGVTVGRLAEHLPPAIMADVLSGALSAGAMTPESVLQVAGPSVLAEHIPADVLWAIIQLAVARSGLNKEGHMATTAESGFLAVALVGAVKRKLITAETLLEHATPSVLSASLPADQSAALLTAGLASPSMNAQLIVDTLTVDGLVTHLSSHVVWAAVVTAAPNVDASAQTAAPKPVAKPMDRRKATGAPALSRSRVPPKGRNPKIKRATNVKLRAGARSGAKK